MWVILGAQALPDTFVQPPESFESLIIPRLQDSRPAWWLCQHISSRWCWQSGSRQMAMRVTEDAVLGAFVLPNAPVQPTTPLTAFSVPVEALEEAAGRRLAWLFTSQFRVESCLGDLQQP